MYDVNFIRDSLRKYIDKKLDKFIIYPFGINGVNTRNILKDYFDLTPCFIVDNEYSKYNSAIINKHMLKDVWQQDMYIIITIENASENMRIVKEILEFIPISNIINLKSENVQDGENDIKGFRLHEFLPSLKLEIKVKVTNKIKVRIMHSEVMCWNAIDTICRAFKEDTLFDVLLIISAVIDREEVIRQAQEKGYHNIILDEYCVEDDAPDILILHNPYASGETMQRNYRKYTKLIVVASFQLIIYDDTIEDFLLAQKRAFGKYCPDYFLYDSLLYKEIEKAGFISKNIIEMGNAKFDGIYQAIQKKKYPTGWEKLEGKRTVLWAFSHGVVLQKRGGVKIQKYLTFDLYAKTIFEYVEQNHDMGFIFRPHKGFINEMLKYKFWSLRDLKLFKEYCYNSPNIVYDDRDTYDISFSIADGILTDAWCGVICSALPTLKPICACYRPENTDDLSCSDGLLASLYSVHNDRDITTFLDMIKNGQDPMLELREKASRKYIKNFDGKNGRRIKEFIKSKYFEMERK